MALDQTRADRRRGSDRPRPRAAPAAPAGAARRVDASGVARCHRGVRGHERGPSGRIRRYYGGPAGLVIGRDGSRTLVVMYDEVPVAQELGETDEVLPYGERGFGINLNPLPLLAAAVAEVGVVRSAGRSASATSSAAWRSCSAQTGTPNRSRSCRLCTGSGWSRTRTSSSRCSTHTSSPGSGSGRSGSWRSSRTSPRSRSAGCAGRGAERERGPDRVPCRPTLGAGDGEGLLPDPRREPRAVQRGDAVVADIGVGPTATGATPPRPTCQGRTPRRPICGRGCSRSWPRPAPNWCPATPARPCSTP